MSDAYVECGRDRRRQHDSMVVRRRRAREAFQRTYWVVCTYPSCRLLEGPYLRLQAHALAKEGRDFPKP